MDELKRFENDLKSSDELKKKLKETLRHLSKEGQTENDGELMVAAAKELGYSISLAALERAKAEAEELDPEALNEAAGGSIDWCIKDYECAITYITNKEDQDGHNTFCFTAWHCFTAVIHTEGGRKDEACWSNYMCTIFSNHSCTEPYL